MDTWILPSGRWSSRKVPPQIRFWRHVDKNGPVPQHRPNLGPCWVWTGSKSGRGYGRFGVTWKRGEYSHRYSWQLAHGQAPGPYFVCHHCDNPPCVNPEHLFLGDHAANAEDMVAKGRAKNGGGLAGADNPNAKLTNDQVIELLRLYREEDLTQLAIAERLGVSRTEVGRILRGKNWSLGREKTGPLYRRGARGGMAKLTEEQARAILDSSGTTAAVAREFGVSPNLVGLIRRGKVWSHLGPRKLGA